MHLIRVHKRPLLLFLIILALGLAITARPAGPAIAAELVVSSTGTGEPVPGEGVVSATPIVPMPSPLLTRGTRDVPDFEPSPMEIRTRASRASATAVTRTSERLEAAARLVDEESRTQQESAIAARLASRFGGTSDGFLTERSILGISWGELVIAHALFEFAPTGWTVEQLVALRKDQLGWGDIAAGLGVEFQSARAGVPAPAEALAPATALVPTPSPLLTRNRAIPYFAPTRSEIRTRASRTSGKAVTRADLRLERVAKLVDDQTRAQDHAVIADRLVSRFGGTTDGLLTQHSILNVSWGHLVIAHALLEHAPRGWTVDQLVALRKDLLGWGEIAAGLGLELRSVLRSTEQEVRIATGQVRADAREDLVTNAAARPGIKRRR